MQEDGSTTALAGVFDTPLALFTDPLLQGVQIHFLQRHGVRPCLLTSLDGRQEGRPCDFLWLPGPGGAYLPALPAKVWSADNEHELSEV